MVTLYLPGIKAGLVKLLLHIVHHCLNLVPVGAACNEKIVRKHADFGDIQNAYILCLLIL